MQRTPIIDWPLLLSRLRARSGIAIAKFADDAGMDEKTINRLARGEINQPRFDQGVMILDLCADYLTDADWNEIRDMSAIGRAA